MGVVKREQRVREVEGGVVLRWESCRRGDEGRKRSRERNKGNKMREYKLLVPDRKSMP